MHVFVTIFVLLRYVADVLALLVVRMITAVLTVQPKMAELL
jgi:hypothetical protein